MSACLSPSMGPNAADRYFIRPGLSCVHATLKLLLNYPSIKALDGATDHATLRMARPNKSMTSPPTHPPTPSMPPASLHQLQKCTQIYINIHIGTKRLMHIQEYTCTHPSLHTYTHTYTISFHSCEDSLTKGIPYPFTLILS